MLLENLFLHLGLKLIITISNVSKKILNLVQRIFAFPLKDIQEISFKVVQKNVFFAHPENALIGMLSDEEEDASQDTFLSYHSQKAVNVASYSSE